MIGALVFGITMFVGPHPSPQGQRRNTFAAIAASTFFLEGVADCEQTKTRIYRFNAVENNKLTPVSVLQQFHRDHAGLCIAGFGLSSAALYLGTRRMDQTVPAVPVLLEGLNLIQQGHSS